MPDRFIEGQRIQVRDEGRVFEAFVRVRKNPKSPPEDAKFNDHVVKIGKAWLLSKHTADLAGQSIRKIGSRLVTLAAREAYEEVGRRLDAARKAG